MYLTRSCSFKILISKRLSQVCCSLDSSLILAKDGTLHTFGDNSLGQLGRPSLPEHGPEDWLMRDAAGTPLRFKHVAAGLGHCLAVTLDGKVCTDQGSGILIPHSDGDTLAHAMVV